MPACRVPRQTDSSRKFYTSLRAQIPESAMAERWLMERGLLEGDELEDEKADAGKESEVAARLRRGRSRQGSYKRKRPLSRHVLLPQLLRLALLFPYACAYALSLSSLSLSLPRLLSCRLCSLLSF